MNLSILLLDCSRALEEKLKRQGFDVVSGSVGYVSEPSFLPGPVYEYEVLIYNPKHAIEPEVDSEMAGARKARMGPTEGSPLEVALNKAREVELKRLNDLYVLGNQTTHDFEPLSGHIQRGATVLIFINHVSDSPSLLNAAYSWVPNMPQIAPTRDFKPLTCMSMDFGNSEKTIRSRAFAEVPLLALDDLKRPVLQKIMLNEAFAGAVPLFFNRQGDFLGLSLEIGKGRIIALPEYEDNEYVISNFLNRVLPRLYGDPSRRDIVEAFNSPMQQIAKDEIQNIESERKALDERLEEAKVKLASAERLKKHTVKNDETAIQLIRYFELATQQEDVALFYLYKIIEALEKKFGGEKAAKDSLGKNAE